MKLHLGSSDRPSVVLCSKPGADCVGQCYDKARVRLFQFFEVALEIHWNQIDLLPKLAGKFEWHRLALLQTCQMPRRLDTQVSQNGPDAIGLRRRPPVNLL